MVSKLVEGPSRDHSPTMDGVEGNQPLIESPGLLQSNPQEYPTPDVASLSGENSVVHAVEKDLLRKCWIQFMQICESSRGLPNMEWAGSDFVPTRPASQPAIRVSATIMLAEHKKFGLAWKGSRRGVYHRKLVEGTSDSGSQVPIDGLDFLEKIKCPKDFLIPTCQRIMGISCML